jgi:hypothetical protein
MKRSDFDAISEIMGKYGFVEWSLIGFTPTREYSIFSYFTDPSIMPIFKCVLLSILRQLNDYLENKNSLEKVAHKGVC